MKHTSSLKERRKLAGTWLKELREQAGLTQMEVANRVGFKYYAFVSQVENGFSRLPVEKLEVWALTVGVAPPRFARQLMSYYEPELHRILYESDDADLVRSM